MYVVLRFILEARVLFELLKRWRSPRCGGRGVRRRVGVPGIRKGVRGYGREGGTWGYPRVHGRGRERGEGGPGERSAGSMPDRFAEVVVNHGSDAAPTVR